MTLPTRTAPESTDVTAHAGRPLTAPAAVNDWPTTETVMLRPERDHADVTAGVSDSGHVNTAPVTPPRDRAAGHVNAGRERVNGAAHVTGVNAPGHAGVNAPAGTEPDTSVRPAGHVTEDKPKQGRWAPGAPMFYLASLMFLSVSLNTSWLFFTHHLVIHDVRERIVMFSVIEVIAIACGIRMRAQVVRGQGQLSTLLLALLVVGASAYMSVMVSPEVALAGARVVFGPAGAFVALHYALGAERSNRDAPETTWQKIKKQYKQRFLSYLGIAEEEVTALQLRHRRYAGKAAKLITEPHVWRKDSRVAKALRAADIAGDPDSRSHLIDHLAVARNQHALYDLRPDAPWDPTSSEPAPKEEAPAASAPVAPRRTRANSRPGRRPQTPRRPAAATVTVEEPVEPPAVDEPAATPEPTTTSVPLVDNVIQMSTARPGVKAAAVRLLAHMDANGITEVPSTKESARIGGCAAGYGPDLVKLVREMRDAREHTA
jgi:hypothetical protein